MIRNFWDRIFFILGVEIYFLVFLLSVKIDVLGVVWKIFVFFWRSGIGRRVKLVGRGGYIGF